MSRTAAHGPSAAGPSPAGEDQRWRVLKPSGRWGRRVPLSVLWDYRELVQLLTLRDLKLRYRQTAFGVSWALLQPAAAVAVFSLVFGRLVGVPSDGLPYPLFALSGLIVFTFLSSAVGAAADSLLEHRALVTEVWLPRILAPVSSVLAMVADLLIGLVLLVPFLIAYEIRPPLQVLTLPLWLGGAIALAIGVGVWLAAANVLYRDVRYTLGFLMQLWLFISPVVFPSSLVEGGWQQLVFALNPAAGVIDGVRSALLDGPGPGIELAVSAGSLAFILLSGTLYFRIAERTFADRI